MLPPLLRVFLNEPGLLHTYAAAYTELVHEEAGELQRRLGRRIAYVMGFAGSMVLAIAFIGVAVMLYAVSGKGHWLLWLVPAIPLMCALILAGLVWRAPRETSFPKTRAQLNEDIQVFGLKEVQ